MELVPPSRETLKNIFQSINLNTEQHRRDTELLKTWLNSQPHLPHDLDDSLLSSFLVGCKNSLERAKTALDSYLTNRTTCPDFYQHRDPCDPAFRKMSRVVRYVTLPRMTTEGYRVTIYSLVSPDTPAKDIDLCLNASKVLCSYDVRFLEDPFWAGDVIVIDSKNYTLTQLPALMVLPVLKKYIHCVTNTLPVRFKKIIFINMSPVVEIILKTIKPLLKQKIAQRIIATSEDHKFLYNHVPQDILPEEYGGKAGKLTELNDAWQLKVESYREWFLNDMKRKVDESLRPEKSKYKPKEQMFGVEGSFKTLTID
ncbi:alpha-tocopherol transfer protein-like [Macrosteles quadrilineatus]|uniref:alpha-tocopherol transfer protein-like n=1 Tax=Macrosteles quadrilineatus TaxID=74068 RepID=UPI0023E25C05|nr:alpha-tocopherol transfer protein-like [Macrosteles quadrilineatus]